MQQTFIVVVVVVVVVVVETLNSSLTLRCYRFTELKKIQIQIKYRKTKLISCLLRFSLKLK